MKITFVAIGSEQMAISLLSGIAKKEGHEVSLAFSASMFHDRYNLELPGLARWFDDTDEVYRKIASFQPDVIVFSSITATYQWSLDVAAQVKKMFPHVRSIFGGVHVSAVPHRVIVRQQVDYLVIGEGELAFTKILSRIAAGETGTVAIENTWYRSSDGEIIKGPQVGFNQELDDLPPFDKTIWEDDIRIRDKYFAMASRGCPYRCTFCFNNFFAELPDDKKTKGKYVRFRSVDHIIGELKQARLRYGKIKFIDFQDDVFTANKKWLQIFLPRYKAEIGVPFQCLTHPKYMDEEVAQWMSDAGCKWVQMGVQSMDEEFKRNTLLRYERSDDVQEACRVMAKYGIKVKLDHMFGLPGEPLIAQENALKLYVQYPPSRIQTFWTSFLPGTEMFKAAVADGTISAHEADRVEEGIDFLFYRSNDDVIGKEMITLYRKYEFIFKIMPLLPLFARKRISVRSVSWIPQFIRQQVGTIADLLTGLSYGNPDFVAYMWHYIFHLRKWAARKLFNRHIPATKVPLSRQHYALISVRPEAVVVEKEPVIEMA